MRTDKPELPFHDIQVRKALAMGINRQEIKDSYFGGNAEILAHPIMPFPEFSDAYLPLEEQPASVQELFTYNPQKARQLLAEAGYPDGFKTEIVCWTGSADIMSIVKAYWEDIGVDLSIDVKEYGVYIQQHVRRTHKEMIAANWVASTPRTMNNLRPNNYTNWMMIDDPYLNDVYIKTQENFFDWAYLCQLWKEANTYILEQAWEIALPSPYYYAMWHPWLNDYHGEFSLGCYNQNMHWAYVWIDQDLKEEMTGTR